MDQPPIPAASLIVVREPSRSASSGATGSSGEPLPELLMVERSRAMVFAGGALVFPGGRIDAADHRLAERFDLPDAAARIAAVRETIEETAVPAALVPMPSPEGALELQSELAAGGDFGELLDAAAIAIDLAALSPFAHWVPPDHVRERRFDTLFYVCAAPRGDWRPKIDGTECADSCWMSSAETLRRASEGSATIIFPTRRILERLAQHRDFASVRADAAAFPVERISPWTEQVDGENWLRIPDHLGYPVTRQRFDR